MDSLEEKSVLLLLDVVSLPVVIIMLSSTCLICSRDGCTEFGLVVSTVNTTVGGSKSMVLVSSHAAESASFCSSLPSPSLLLLKEWPPFLLIMTRCNNMAVLSADDDDDDCIRQSQMPKSGLKCCLVPPPATLPAAATSSRCVCTGWYDKAEKCLKSLASLISSRLTVLADKKLMNLLPCSWMASGGEQDDDDDALSLVRVAKSVIVDSVTQMMMQ
mmetsp:Transcript_1288/g.2490  ORF Transcript_1288/g.2490 Transcript_1288/m.2490 type:complete len:216 (-) Transcript_1288:68-715(-)